MGETAISKDISHERSAVSDCHCSLHPVCMSSLANAPGMACAQHRSLPVKIEPHPAACNALGKPSTPKKQRKKALPLVSDLVVIGITAVLVAPFLAALAVDFLPAEAWPKSL